jgi:hypothetical protein
VFRRCKEPQLLTWNADRHLLYWLSKFLMEGRPMAVSLSSSLSHFISSSWQCVWEAAGMGRQALVRQALERQEGRQGEEGEGREGSLQVLE